MSAGARHLRRRGWRAPAVFRPALLVLLALGVLALQLADAGEVEAAPSQETVAFVAPPLNVPPLTTLTAGAAAGTSVAGVVGAGGALGCAAATLGGCALLIGGVVLAGAGVYAAVNMFYDAPHIDIANLQSPMIQTEWKPCSQMSSAASINAAEANPGSNQYCAFYGWDATLRTNSFGYQRFKYSFGTTPGSGPYTRGCFTYCQPFLSGGNGSFAWGSTGTVSAWSSGDEAHRIYGPTTCDGFCSNYGVLNVNLDPSYGTGASKCFGYMLCAFAPTDTVQITGYGDGCCIVAHASAAIAIHGRPSQRVYNSTCINLDTSATTSNTSYSAWMWADEVSEGDFPMAIPSCPTTGRWAIKRLVTTVREVGYGTRTLFDVTVPDYALQTQLDIREARANGSTTWRPHVDGGVCYVGDVPANMYFCNGEDWLDANPQATQTVTPAPRPDTSTAAPAPSAPPTTGTAPPTTGTEEPAWMTDTPNNADDDADSSDCMPSGWGLLNPVDWVLKPVKCALKWAFVPSTALSLQLAALRTEVDDSAIGTITDLVGSFQSSLSGAVAGAEGTGSCQGPPMRFTRNESQVVYPLSSCSAPVSGIATLFRALAQAAVVLLGALLIYNRIVRPFGIEPLSIGRGDVVADYEIEHMTRDR